MIFDFKKVETNFIKRINECINPLKRKMDKYQKQSGYKKIKKKTIKRLYDILYLTGQKLYLSYGFFLPIPFIEKQQDHRIGIEWDDGTIYVLFSEKKYTYALLSKGESIIIENDGALMYALINVFKFYYNL